MEDVDVNDASTILLKLTRSQNFAFMLLGQTTMTQLLLLLEPVAIAVLTVSVSVSPLSSPSPVNLTRSVYMLVTICPKCNIPRPMIVKPKLKSEELTQVYCPECSTIVKIGELVYREVN